jgi:predicted metal-dependent phosphoesterase TrpH
MKCDLHVHSWHSGMCTQPVAKRICRESYSAPEEVYARLKSKGMDLVTLTDHDSIGGAECLRRNPDFFLSEEVTCSMPSGTKAHIGVLDLTERDHVEIQRRRDDLVRLLPYLTERRLLFSVNHVFSNLTGRRTMDDFWWFQTYFPAMEVRNGQMPPFHNQHAEQLARKQGMARVGGSDAHTILSLGSVYTEVPGATDKNEFLDGVRAGKAVMGGTHGGYLRLTRDVLYIATQMVRHSPSKALFIPFLGLVPIATFASSLNEIVFARRWSTRVGASPAGHLRSRILSETG